MDFQSPLTYRSQWKNPRQSWLLSSAPCWVCEEVMECYLMTGAFDYIVRVVASDMAGIERFVMTRLATIKGVRDVSTSITLRRVQYKTVLPVRESGE
ncbi:Lrp/AsnC ligand binding domain-containing protein [Paraburkholderia sp. RL17-337-BIB-A]|uniref:Lrp/AsnC ligand binding domain-containing protein n=1 Tax=Paraburkholderia sp. RL17-337-BIB-A TaxID=3031636 RepID=UPI0038BB384D